MTMYLKKFGAPIKCCCFDIAKGEGGTFEFIEDRKTTGFGLGLSIVNNLSKSNSYKCYLKSSSADKTIFYLQKENK